VDADLRGAGSQALYRAALLAGEMPHEIVDVFDGLDLPLFPVRMDMRCSCPDWAMPCKHASAVLYVLAEAFDDDPFLVLAWRGRAREAAGRAARHARTGRASIPLAVREVPLGVPARRLLHPGCR
jgi:uncharacterized Zn finger protein